jgi:uncharacterized membrane protein
MGKWIVGYAGAGVTFIALDMVWLNVVAPAFYRAAIGHLLAGRFNGGAAIAFYILYVAGLAAFALKPGFEAHSLVAACLWGTAFGLVAYATYDLTNMATLKDWPLRLTVVDMVWGAVASGIASGVGFAIASAFVKTAAGS